MTIDGSNARPPTPAALPAPDLVSGEPSIRKRTRLRAAAAALAAGGVASLSVVLLGAPDPGPIPAAATVVSIDASSVTVQHVRRPDITLGATS